jgi:recombinational DNA repair ATPase RecF
MLKLAGVGPTTKVELDLAPRLNLITGDNGLGKTFLLECAWWALTGIWSGFPARPRQDADRDEPRITFHIGKSELSDREQTARYNWDQLKWITPSKRNVLPGLCLY